MLYVDGCCFGVLVASSGHTVSIAISTAVTSHSLYGQHDGSYRRPCGFLLSLLLEPHHCCQYSAGLSIQFKALLHVLALHLLLLLMLLPVPILVLLPYCKVSRSITICCYYHPIVSTVSPKHTSQIPHRKPPKGLKYPMP